MRHLALPPSFRVIDILPLCELLKAEATVQSLDFSACDIGDSGCYVLEDMLRNNATVRGIDLSSNNVTFRGAVALANALAINVTVSWLNLAGNRIGSKGAQALAPIVEQSPSLRFLNVCNCGLRVKGVLCLHDALTRRMRHSKARMDLGRPRRAGNGLPFLGQRKGDPPPASASVAPRATDPAFSSGARRPAEASTVAASDATGTASGARPPAIRTAGGSGGNAQGDFEVEDRDQDGGALDSELEFEVDEEGARLMEACDREWMREQGHRDVLTPLSRPHTLPLLPPSASRAQGTTGPGQDRDSLQGRRGSGSGSGSVDEDESPLAGSESASARLQLGTGGSTPNIGDSFTPRPQAEARAEANDTTGNENEAGNGDSRGSSHGTGQGTVIERAVGSLVGHLDPQRLMARAVQVIGPEAPTPGSADSGAAHEGSANADLGGLAESILPGDHPDLRADELWAMTTKGEARDGIDVRWGGNFVQEEVLNSVIHGVGFVLALAGGVPLLQRAHASGDDAYLGGAAVYLVGLLVFYLAATLRHSFFLLRSTSRMFHVIDHSAIFVLIAGTYTPFTLVNMQHLLVGRAVLVASWSCALVGLYISVTCARKQPWPTVKRLLYLAMGWLGLVATPWVRVCVDPAGVTLLVGGGIIYSAGALAYITQRRAPPYSARRSAWYLLVLLASVLHYAAVFAYVRKGGDCTVDWGGATDPWAWMPFPDMSTLAELAMRGPAWLLGGPEAVGSGTGEEGGGMRTDL